MDILIRSPGIGDKAAINAIYQFDSVLEQTGQIPHRDEEFWPSFYKNKGGELVELVAEINGVVVGHLGLLLNPTPRRKHCASFGIAIHPESQGQGVGSALMRETLHLCDNWLNISRIELSVFCDNQHAVALYRKCGFVIEGEAIGAVYKNGQYSNSYHMARLNPSLTATSPLPPDA